MGRGLASRPRACDVHPHRAAQDRCDECLGHFCGECFVRDGPRLRCRACWEAAPLRAAEAARRRRLRYRLRQFRAWSRDRTGGFVAVAAIAACLAAAVGFAWWGTRSGGAGATAAGLALGDEPGVALRIATQRYCAANDGSAGDVPGAGPPDAGPAPTARTDTGAVVAVVASALTDSGDTGAAGRPEPTGHPGDLGPRRAEFHDPLTLVHRRDEGSPGWRSHSAVLPQQVGFDLGGITMLDRVAFRHTALSPKASWAQEVSLLLSTQAPDAGYYRVGRWMLAPTTAPQEFVFFETPARYVRVCIDSAHGTADFVSLGAVVLGVYTSDLRAGSSPLLPTPAPSRSFTR